MAKKDDNYANRRDLKYIHEKLRIAVVTLAEGPGAIRERLEDAFISSLHILFTFRGGGDSGTAALLPANRRGGYTKLKNLFDVDEGSRQKALAKLTDDEAMDLAKKIVALEAAVLAMLHNN